MPEVSASPELRLSERCLACESSPAPVSAAHELGSGEINLWERRCTIHLRCRVKEFIEQRIPDHSFAQEPQVTGGIRIMQCLFALITLRVRDAGASAGQRRRLAGLMATAPSRFGVHEAIQPARIRCFLRAARADSKHVDAVTSDNRTPQPEG